MALNPEIRPRGTLWRLLRCFCTIVVFLHISVGDVTDEHSYIISGEVPVDFFGNDEEGPTDESQSYPIGYPRDDNPGFQIPLEDVDTGPQDDDLSLAEYPEDHQDDFYPSDGASVLSSDYEPIYYVLDEEVPQDGVEMIHDNFEPFYTEEVVEQNPKQKTKKGDLASLLGRKDDDDDDDLDNDDAYGWGGLSHGDRFGYSDRFYNLKSYTHRNIFDRTTKKFAPRRRDWNYHASKNYAVHKYKHHPLDKFGTFSGHPLDKYSNKPTGWGHDYGYKLRNKYYLLRDKLDHINDYKYNHHHSGWGW